MVLSNRQRSAHRAALALAQSFGTLAAKLPDPNDRLIGERLIGVFAILPGRPLQRAAPSRAHARSLRPLLPRSRTSFASRSDQQVTARVVLARNPVAAGISGSVDARSRKQHRRTLGLPITQCHWGLALGLAACPIALFIGDLALAEHYVENAARPFDKACAGRAGRALGRSYQGVPPHRARRSQHRITAAGRAGFRRTRRGRVRSAAL